LLKTSEHGSKCIGEIIIADLGVTLFQHQLLVNLAERSDLFGLFQLPLDVKLGKTREKIAHQWPWFPWAFFN